MEYYVIDRIEEFIAVCENEERQKVEFSLNKLYPDAKEGDWFYILNGEAVYSNEKTQIVREQNQSLLKELWGE